MSTTISPNPALADPRTYLSDLCSLLSTAWPTGHRTVNIVCHGHSVPAGYFMTPHVDTFNAYPHLLHVNLKDRFPNAVLNVIVTAIGGENSEKGAARFAADVFPHRPDLITLDYALNDRRIGLDKARAAWTDMINQARARNIKMILLTPTGDLAAQMDDPADPLHQHAALVRELAAEHHLALADSFAAFAAHVRAGHPLDTLMSSRNHPNRAGHDLVVRELLQWFP